MEKTIVRYDIAKGTQTPVGFPDAEQRQYQEYDRIHVPKGRTNVLHFSYNAVGKLIRDGVSYRRGVYSLDIPSGTISWFGDLLDDVDDESHKKRAADGRFVFFKGHQGPLSGFELVWSDRDFIEAHAREPDAKGLNRIHEFSREAASRGGSYVLHCISPCGGYAVVRFMECRAWETKWLNLYYLVDLSTGATRLFIRDEVQRTTDHRLSPLYWTR